MRSTNDNPLDPLGSIGKPIRPEAPKQSDPVKEFERISDKSKAIDTIAEALKNAGLPVVTDGQEADWEGLCADDFRAGFWRAI